MRDLAGDPGLRVTVEAARSWGVSPRRMLGWEPVTTTVHEYDDAGRLVRSTTTVEPEWGPEDHELALSLLAYEAQLCPGCHAPVGETTAPEREFGYTTEAVMCHRCVAIGREHERWARSGSAPHAMLVTARLREEVPGGAGPVDG